jgi:hypothetical protein
MVFARGSPFFVVIVVFVVFVVVVVLCSYNKQKQ